MHSRSRTLCLALLAGFLMMSPACKERSVKVAAPTTRTVNETVGSGPSARDGSVATIRYKLTTVDGSKTILESEKYSFEVGASSVIAAVDTTVRGMRVGGRRIVECPPETHWGRAGYGGKIDPNTPLKLDVQLLSVQ